MASESRRNSPFEKLLGQVVAEFRREAGYSQEALADLAGLHATYVSQLERGVKSPTVRVLRAIAGALDIPASKLLSQAEAAAPRKK